MSDHFRFSENERREQEDDRDGECERSSQYAEDQQIAQRKFDEGRSEEKELQRKPQGQLRVLVEQNEAPLGEDDLLERHPSRVKSRRKRIAREGRRL